MIKILIFTAILAIAIFVAEQFLIPGFIHTAIWVMLGYFFVLSVLGHRIVEKGIRSNQDNIVLYYFTVMLIRLLVSAIFIAGYLYIGTREIGTREITIFIANFFILYLLYVTFEIKTLLTNLQRNSKQQERHEPQNLS
jgi:small-conductance mechanosensitive channel